jgi:tRNA-dihydrouridine synthase B
LGSKLSYCLAMTTEIKTQGRDLHAKPFSDKLQSKIDALKSMREPVKLGQISFASPLLLAPMSAICNAPFRLLMEQLGAGGTVSELVSCHGINYKNEKTRRMLYIDPRERNIGLQLFGEDTEAMAEAAIIAQEYKPNFIDINMGCPVRKVVTKGGGSALLKDTKKLAAFFGGIKKKLNIPLTIKIRTGWDEDSINADEVINIALGEGVEFVAVHGRTRTQQYKGKANWHLLEELAEKSKLPIIGNGDLHSAPLTKARMEQTKCDALMLGRGPLRDPFIFLTSYLENPAETPFGALDYWEIVERYYEYLTEYTDLERAHLIQLRKMIVWFVAGFPGVADFRGHIFKTQSVAEVFSLTQDYLGVIAENEQNKKLNLSQPFMMGGHG